MCSVVRDSILACYLVISERDVQHVLAETVNSVGAIDQGKTNMSYGCPHCLNNWPCNEPLEACVRRNKFIARSHEVGSRRNHTRARTQETPPGNEAKLTAQTTYLWRGRIVSPECNCDLVETQGEHFCTRKTWRWRNKEAERLKSVSSGSCSGKPPSHPAGDRSLGIQTTLF